MKVLVTGAAGFLGSHLTDRLLNRGDEVVGLDSFDEFYSRSIKASNLVAASEQPGFELIEGDIRDATALRALPEGIDAVVHLAARAGVRPSLEQPALYHDVNVMGTVQLLEFARARGIRPFVFASSSSVYGNNDKVPFAESDAVDRPISPYAATKKACELTCHAYAHLYGMSIPCLRFFTVYGPRQRPDLAIHKFARLLSEGRPIPMFGDGSTERDYTYVDDIMDGVLRALAWARETTGGYEIVNLGENQTISLLEMIQTVGEEMGIEPRIDRQPMQPGDVVRTWADVSKAGALLGYEPRTDFRTGVREFVRWFRSQRHLRPSGANE